MKCDCGCGAEVDPAAQRNLMVRLTSWVSPEQQGRIETRRFWNFCGPDCLDKWWHEAGAEDLIPVSDTPRNEKQQHEIDPLVRGLDDGALVIASYVREGKGHDKAFDLQEQVQVEACDHVNQWWVEPPEKREGHWTQKGVLEAAAVVAEAKLG